MPCKFILFTNKQFLFISQSLYHVTFISIKDSIFRSATEPKNVSGLAFYYEVEPSYNAFFHIYGFPL